MDDPPATCRPCEKAVILATWHPGGRAVLTPAEAEQLSADLLRSAAAARAYTPAVSEAVRARNAKNGRKRRKQP